VFRFRAKENNLVLPSYFASMNNVISK